MLSPGPKSCLAVCSGDTVPVLVALSAQVAVIGPGGERVVPLKEMYSGKGESHINLLPDEILVNIRIPVPWAPIGGSYQRLAMRSAIDFPLVNAACVAITDKGKVQTFRLVLAALGPGPVVLKDLEARCKGARPSPSMADMAAEAALNVAAGVAVGNTIVGKEYRVKMAGVMARRAVRGALSKV